MKSTASCTTKPQPLTGRRHVCSWQHLTCVLDYRAAREADELARDEAVGLYGPGSAEWAEWTEARNMITFKTWLIQTHEGLASS